VFQSNCCPGASEIQSTPGAPGWHPPPFPIKRPSERSDPLNSLNIVVLHTEPSSRNRILGQLRDSGFENALGFASSGDARSTCKSTPPDILIVDTTVADVSSVELIQRCRAAHSRVRVVLTSAVAAVADSAGPLQRLADATLVSPIGIWELRQTIQNQVQALEAPAA
jgi:DNA-binding response OmpR family regulator